MQLRMSDALLPYFGGKRKLCPVIFRCVSEYLPREHWGGKVFIDAFLGSGAVSLYAKAQGFKVVANDIAERSVLAGQALIENNNIFLTFDDLYKLFIKNRENKGTIQELFVPRVFTRRHAAFLDNALANATRPIDRYLLMKYIFFLRPYSKFSSPNAFNIPMEEERYDEIKQTYIDHIEDNLKMPIEILKIEKDRINAGIFSNGLKNEIYKKDVFDFIEEVKGGVLYLDPPYAGTLRYEGEYRILDEILRDKNLESKFSNLDGLCVLNSLLSKSDKFPLWVISYGNAGGNNRLNELIDIVSKYRKCEVKEFVYQHCESMASEEHKQKCREWLVMGWK